MSSNKRTQSINKMNNYIWSFEGKCEGVNELNRGLITDYCRFTIMANELADELAKNVDNMNDADFDLCMKKYEKTSKSALTLYKILKFEQINPKKVNKENPFVTLYREAEADGDF